MMRGNSGGTNHGGLFLPSMMDHMAQWRTGPMSSALR